MSLVHKARAAGALPPAPSPGSFPDFSGPANRSTFLLIPKGQDMQGQGTKFKNTKMP